MHKHEVEIQDFVAALYPIRYSGTGFLYHSRIVTDMLKEARFKDGKTSDKILDVGCGIGFVSQLYPNFDIVGIDVSDEMLKRNPHKWIKAEAENIPFDNNTFDFVICRSLLHHLEHPHIGLAEMFRVLKPGGRWVCWDPNYSFFSEIFRKIARNTSRFSHIHKNFRASELLDMIRYTGFEIVEERYIGFLAYPLLGFPDIINFRIPLGIGRALMAFDKLLEKTIFRKLAWSLMIKAAKA